MTKLNYVLALITLTLGLTIFSNKGMTLGCTTELTCESTNSSGAQLVGTNDIEYWEGTNCLSQWDCEYSDGFQTRHYGEPLDPDPE